MQLTINSYYSFLTRAPGILGATYSNMRLVSVMTYDLARNFIDINAMHANIYPTLPSGFPDNPQGYTYYMFKTENGENAVFADIWIDTGSITEKSSQSIMVEINKISNSDITRIQTTLTSMGYVFSIRTI